MPCPFCNNALAKSTPYPAISFNGKLFHYIRCNECSLVYLDNFPVPADYDAMYPPSYQGNRVDASLLANPYTSLSGLRFSYGYQFDLIKKTTGTKAQILDYGCGTGHFLGNAIHSGFKCDGAEFNSEYLRLLKESFTQSNFYTIHEVLEESFKNKYDVIRLSNVLEHLTEPYVIMATLSKLLKPGGVFLIEGPVEDNFSLAEMVRKVYFKINKWIRPDWTISSPPYHIFYSNAKNQQQFFKNCGFKETHYRTIERAWPFPETIRDARGIQQKITALIAKGSMFVTKVSGKNWGNTFIFCGSPKK